METNERCVSFCFVLCACVCVLCVLCVLRVWVCCVLCVCALCVCSVCVLCACVCLACCLVCVLCVWMVCALCVPAHGSLRNLTTSSFLAFTAASHGVSSEVAAPAIAARGEWGPFLC